MEALYWFLSWLFGVFLWFGDSLGLNGFLTAAEAIWHIGDIIFGMIEHIRETYSEQYESWL